MDILSWIGRLPDWVALAALAVGMVVIPILAEVDERRRRDDTG